MNGFLLLYEFNFHKLTEAPRILKPNCAVNNRKAGI
jgi:hypothetical protein